MACPYAKKIRGTVAFCSLINKKVSTLRYPCKGNYKRCPIYIRYRARAAAPAPRPAPATRQAPAAETPRPETPPAAPGGPSVGAPAAPQRPAAPRGPVARPSRSLCDSLILAALITSARAMDRYSGRLKDLVDELSRRTSGGGQLLFFVGQVSGVSVRMLAHKGSVVYAFERGGSPVCGGDAADLYESNAESRVDGIIYEVKWEDIPLWRETVLEEFGG